MTKRCQLILFPGLGADHRQFAPQRSAFPDLLVPPWIPPNRREDLPTYAARLAETIRPTHPMILGGSSFGGMVACALARHLRPEAVVLIGSCRSPQGIRPMLRRLGLLAAVAPSLVFDLAKPFSRLALGAFSRVTRHQRQLCITMFKDADSRFIKWACTAILHWNPGPLEGIPVYRIHGQDDQLIPANRVDADEIVPGAGHLINLTHAEQVNAFIADVLGGIRPVAPM